MELKVNNPCVIISLDFSDAETALMHVEKFDPEHCRLKIGKELFTSSGPAFIEKLVAKGFDIFLDLKFHDIPSTVAKACSAAASLGVWMLNVHASGGRTMLMSAREAIDKSSQQPLLIGVTVLTSLSSEELNEIGISATPEEQVLRLARLSKQSGLDGIVCSAQEAVSLRTELGDKFCLVTPGIRPAGVSANDQKRIMTPAQAIIAGSDYLVIGRPITQAEDPRKALIAINEEINSVPRHE